MSIATVSLSLRWLIARLLNRLPDTCWADLVMWSLYTRIHPFREILELRTAGYCARMGCEPYCGKCRSEQP